MKIKNKNRENARQSTISAVTFSVSENGQRKSIGGYAEATINTNIKVHITNWLSSAVKNSHDLIVDPIRW